MLKKLSIFCENSDVKYSRKENSQTQVIKPTVNEKVTSCFLVHSLINRYVKKITNSSYQAINFIIMFQFCP